MFITSNTHKKVLLFAFLSVMIKITYLLYKYYYGYIENDFDIVRPDEFGYLINGQFGTFDMTIGQHWFYDWINYLMFSVFGNINSSYLAMCLLNIIISILLPYVFLPVIQTFATDQQNYNKLFFSYSIFIFFWPAAIWLATSNLKDIILALLVMSFISGLVKLFHSQRTEIKILYTSLLITIIYLIFSTRSYLAMMLIFGSIFYAFMKIKTNKRGIFFVLAIILLLFGSGIAEYVNSFVSYENNWLINPETGVESGNLVLNQQNPDINYGVIGIGKGMIIFFFNPFPNIFIQNFQYQMLSIQTMFFIFLIIPLILSIKFIRKNELNYFYFAYLSAVILFYSISELISGPRQRFAAFDVFVILFILVSLSNNRFNNRLVLLSISFGLITNAIFILYTARSVLG